MKIYFQITSGLNGYDVHYQNHSNIYVELEHECYDTHYYLDRPIIERMALSEFLHRLNLHNVEFDNHVKHIMNFLVKHVSPQEITDFEKSYVGIYLDKLRRGEIFHPSQLKTKEEQDLRRYEQDLRRYEYEKAKAMEQNNHKLWRESPLTTEDSGKSIDNKIYYLLTP